MHGEVSLRKWWAFMNSPVGRAYCYRSEQRCNNGLNCVFLVGLPQEPRRASSLCNIAPHCFVGNGFRLHGRRIGTGRVRLSGAINLLGRIVGTRLALCCPDLLSLAFRLLLLLPELLFTLLRLRRSFLGLLRFPGPLFRRGTLGLLCGFHGGV